MEYPEPSLAYLRTITDSTGVIQHGHHSVPNRRFGYTTDDNARALIVAVQHYESTRDRSDLELAITYLSFLHYAHNGVHKFRNVMDYTRNWLDDEGTQDCYGRSIWASGHAASSDLPENVRIVARKLFEESIVWVGDLSSPRARAYSMLGMCRYMSAYGDINGMRDKIRAVGQSLIELLNASSDVEWYWFESFLTYGNAILPLAMMHAAAVTGLDDFRRAAVGTMNFLTDTMIIDGRLEVIGNNGWYTKGKNRAWYDQQSIDAGYIVQMYADAYRILGDESYRELAEISYSWFFGNNRSNVWVYDRVTHGCFDAISEVGLNLNQGAESCICYILAQQAMKDIVACRDTSDLDTDARIRSNSLQI